MAKRKSKPSRGEIIYSEDIGGDLRNHRLPVKFDWSDGYFGITQKEGKTIDRVLLSPRQIRALIEFVKTNRG